ncbi:hypothetical protein [Sodalis sp. RH19]|uniref:hypothetical protein n=1 Tax=Sodalis sp. RH19 TaxID=3394334 RepID=UPI0039B4A293
MKYVNVEDYLKGLINKETNTPRLMAQRSHPNCHPARRLMITEALIRYREWRDNNNNAEAKQETI